MQRGSGAESAGGKREGARRGQIHVRGHRVGWSAVIDYLDAGYQLQGSKGNHRGDLILAHKINGRRAAVHNHLNSAKRSGEARVNLQSGSEIGSVNGNEFAGRDTRGEQRPTGRIDDPRWVNEHARGRKAGRLQGHVDPDGGRDPDPKPDRAARSEDVMVIRIVVGPVRLQCVGVRVVVIERVVVEDGKEALMAEDDSRVGFEGTVPGLEVAEPAG